MKIILYNYVMIKTWQFLKIGRFFFLAQLQVYGISKVCPASVVYIWVNIKVRYGANYTRYVLHDSLKCIYCYWDQQLQKLTSSSEISTFVLNGKELKCPVKQGVTSPITFSQNTINVNVHKATRVVEPQIEFVPGSWISISQNVSGRKLIPIFHYKKQTPATNYKDRMAQRTRRAVWHGSQIIKCPDCMSGVGPKLNTPASTRNSLHRRGAGTSVTDGFRAQIE